MLWAIYVYVLGIGGTISAFVSAVVMWHAVRQVKTCPFLQGSELRYTADMLFDTPVERPQSIVLVSFQCDGASAPCWDVCSNESHYFGPYVHRQTIERYHDKLSNTREEPLTSFSRHTIVLLSDALYVNMILWISIIVIVVPHSVVLATNERYLRLVYSASRTRTLLNFARTLIVGITTSATAVGMVTLLVSTQLFAHLGDRCARTENATVAAYVYIVSTILTQIAWTIEPWTYTPADTGETVALDF